MYYSFIYIFKASLKQQFYISFSSASDLISSLYYTILKTIWYKQFTISNNNCHVICDLRNRAQLYISKYNSNVKNMCIKNNQNLSNYLDI